MILDMHTEPDGIFYLLIKSIADSLGTNEKEKAFLNNIWKGKK